MSVFKGFAIAGLALACVTAAEEPRYGAWSPPVNVGPVINTPVTSDAQASLSRDGLSLYFSTWRITRTSMDIYVSHRASIGEPWDTPQELGPSINRPDSFEGMPVLSPDGHQLFFSSNRLVDGVSRRFDIYVSRRQDARDDFGWEPAQNLGPVINDLYQDQPGGFLEDEATGTTTFYLSRIWPGGSDIYTSTVQADGTFTAPVPVEGVNSAYNDQFPTIRRDGLEIIFASDRPGSLGGLDLWFSTRATTADAWSEPQPLAGFNTALIENQPRLSFDGTELYFTTTREGAHDVYVAVRSRLTGKPE